MVGIVEAAGLAIVGLAPTWGCGHAAPSAIFTPLTGARHVATNGDTARLETRATWRFPTRTLSAPLLSSLVVVPPS